MRDGIHVFEVHPKHPQHNNKQGHRKNILLETLSRPEEHFTSKQTDSGNFIDLASGLVGQALTALTSACQHP